jgi:uncharacterized protein (TIGR02722 family)
MKMNHALLILTGALLLGGCSGTTVSYGDPTETETVTVDYGSSDLQAIADKMADSMLASPATSEITAGGRPVMFMDSIRNKTSEHIDTEAITDTIRTKLLRRQVPLRRHEQGGAVKQQLEYQQQRHGGSASMVRLGKQTGARYMVYGNLASIVKDNGKVKDVYYQMTMNLMDLQNGELLWADQKEIRKQAKKSTFGW